LRFERGDQLDRFACHVMTAREHVGVLAAVTDGALGKQLRQLCSALAWRLAQPRQGLFRATQCALFRDQ
jgi:hypothetical protein